MTEPRIIKKYPNRRLYDTADSRYITLSDICQLVMDREGFEVIDQKSGDNLTCGILLQVMAEQVNSGRTVVSRDMLTQMIRVYCGRLPEALQGYLHESLSLFLVQHQKIDELLGEKADTGAVSGLAELAQHNLTRWIELNKALLRAADDGGLTEADERSKSLETFEA
jgi:polyhydroxyalkanoate synthesis repressor PhaR